MPGDGIIGVVHLIRLVFANLIVFHGAQKCDDTASEGVFAPVVKDCHFPRPIFSSHIWRETVQ